MFADEVRESQQPPPPDLARFRLLSVTRDGRVQRALAVLWREHDVIACADPAGAAALAASRDVDAVLCDQRLPPVLGVDLLRDIRQAHPRALRMLLSARADARLLLDAVNEAEVFRFISQPWNIAAMREASASALRAARLAPPLTGVALSDEESERVHKLMAVVVIESEAATQQRLRDLLQGHYKTHFANSLDRALQFMEQHETGALLCSTASGRGELIAALKALKQAHPHLATIAIDALDDADRAVELINEAQIFRLLRRPFNPALCRPYVDAALARYWQIKQQPQSAWRVMPAESSVIERSPQQLPSALLNRIRGLPGRLHESEGTR
jgi:DNA-binding NtrC family response regulator